MWGTRNQIGSRPISLLLANTALLLDSFLSPPFLVFHITQNFFHPCKFPFFTHQIILNDFFAMHPLAAGFPPLFSGPANWAEYKPHVAIVLRELRILCFRINSGGLGNYRLLVLFIRFLHLGNFRRG